MFASIESDQRVDFFWTFHRYWRRGTCTSTRICTNVFCKKIFGVKPFGGLRLIFVVESLFRNFVIANLHGVWPQNAILLACRNYFWFHGKRSWIGVGCCHEVPHRQNAANNYYFQAWRNQIILSRRGATIAFSIKYLLTRDALKKWFSWVYSSVWGIELHK